MTSLSMKLLTACSLLSSLAMALATLQTKYLTTRDGTNYVYDYIPARKCAANSTSTTVLLLHGYPSTRHDWHHQVSDLSAAGYGVLAPDCLGYGDSDMPLAVEAYNLKRLGGHLMEMLDEEGLQTVVGVGHDWGTNVLSRTAVWHPERFEKLAFLSLGYNVPGLFVDIDILNAMSLEQLGYLQFGYFYFFNSYNGADLAASNVSDEETFSLPSPPSAITGGIMKNPTGSNTLCSLSHSSVSLFQPTTPNGRRTSQVSAQLAPGWTPTPQHLSRAT